MKTQQIGKFLNALSITFLYLSINAWKTTAETPIMFSDNDELNLAALLHVYLIYEAKQQKLTYVGWHDGIGGTPTAVVRRQIGRTSDVISSTCQSTRAAVMVLVDLVVWTVHAACVAVAAFRLDRTVPRSVSTHATRTTHSVTVSHRTVTWLTGASPRGQMGWVPTATSKAPCSSNFRSLGWLT